MHTRRLIQVIACGLALAAVPPGPALADPIQIVNFGSSAHAEIRDPDATGNRIDRQFGAPATASVFLMTDTTTASATTTSTRDISDAHHLSATGTSVGSYTTTSGFILAGGTAGFLVDLQVDTLHQFSFEALFRAEGSGEEGSGGFWNVVFGRVNPLGGSDASIFSNASPGGASRAGETVVTRTGVVPPGLWRLSLNASSQARGRSAGTALGSFSFRLDLSNGSAPVPDPIPEPGTLLLCTTALAIPCLRRRFGSRRCDPRSNQ